MGEFLMSDKTIEYTLAQAVYFYDCTYPTDKTKEYGFNQCVGEATQYANDLQAEQNDGVECKVANNVSGEKFPASLRVVCSAIFKDGSPYTIDEEKAAANPNGADAMMLQMNEHGKAGGRKPHPRFKKRP
jgi:hypothetical protein